MDPRKSPLSLIPFTRLLFLSLLFSWASGCAILPETQKAADKVKILEYTAFCTQKGCPEFSLVLYATGLATYEGRAYTSLMGTYTKQIEKEYWTTVRHAIDSAGLWRIPEEFPVPQPYSPITLINVFEGEYTKSVRGQEFPQEVQKLIGHLEKILNGGNWKLISPPSYGLPEGVAPNILRIQLQPGLNHEYWQSKYFEYGMATIKMLPEANNFWLFRFDPARIQPLTLKEILANDPDVLSSDFEKLPKR